MVQFVRKLTPKSDWGKNRQTQKALSSNIKPGLGNRLRFETCFILMKYKCTFPKKKFCANYVIDIHDTCNVDRFFATVFFNLNDLCVDCLSLCAF